MTTVADLDFSYRRSEFLHARGSALRFDPHVHAFPSVVVVRRGAAEVRTRRHALVVQSGDVFFVNAYEVHSGSSLESGTLFETYYPSQVLWPRTWGRSPTITTDVIRHSRETARWTSAMSSSTATPGVKTQALRALLSLCETSRRPHAMPPLTVDALDRIHRSPTELTSPSRLATELRTGTSRLIREFHARAGMPPQRYSRQVLVSSALSLVLDGQTLADAAAGAGFADQAHLTREFKKVFGVPPGVLARGIRADPHR
ncbi:helix-turn-helix domain-containing protein [Serinicoccus kebangsaanensis]|uniref:helix-turn-helix domain-containing protein n=1 Tax=Serinicoccus kebangsaanensis TaxID=2602069 RepID=UPI00178C2B44|nr:helix-turn-helix domain-containing protein [Serinicoccus kebangsaanensis]